MKKVFLWFKYLVRRPWFWLNARDIQGQDISQAFPYWGVAAYKPLEMKYLMFLVPFNFPVSWYVRWRQRYLFQKYGAAGVLGHDLAVNKYNEGFNAGYINGLEEGLDERIGWGLEQLTTEQLERFVTDGREMLIKRYVERNPALEGVFKVNPAAEFFTKRFLGVL